MTTNLLRPALLALAVCLAHAAVIGGGNGSGIMSPADDGEEKVVVRPAWIDDPTEAGTKKGVATSWPTGALRDEIVKTRNAAIAEGQKTFELPASAKFKEMATWTDKKKAVIWVWLVSK